MRFWQTIRQAVTNRKSHPPTNDADLCFWRVDMHSHLIPGIDDGVGSPEEALTCLKQLADWGIQTVITTPHVSRDWYPNESAIIREEGAALQKLANDHELGLTIQVAAEYLLDEFFTEMLEADDILSFGPARYVLVELGWAAPPRQLDDLLFRIRTRGYTPILAHPERYQYYYDDTTPLIHLHESGCLFQVNWASFLGRYGDRARTQARFLVKKGWVDFISSDMHRPADLKILASLFTAPEYEQLRNQPLLNTQLLSI